MSVAVVEGIMLRFSIREILLLTLTVACLAGWWRYHVTATAERARLAKELRQLHELVGDGQARIRYLQQLQVLDENIQSLEAKLKQMGGPKKSPLETDNARLDADNEFLKAENARLKRRLLDHDTQLEILLERFHQAPSGY
ncbi:MAG TPA: hypothetical protein VMP01_17340 [Pirellulaceae bacterium]|nr:hypothetical protein [Pirellulaceae bacterium]